MFYCSWCNLPSYPNGLPIGLQKAFLGKFEKLRKGWELKLPGKAFLGKSSWESLGNLGRKGLVQNGDYD